MTSSGSKLQSLGFVLTWNKSQEQYQSSKAYAGMGIGDGIISLLDPEKIDGVVIEALGAGNLPPLAAREITNLMEKGVPVVLVSRCFNGIAETCLRL